MRLRFDIGRDGCGGLDGWYVDNVQVTNCDVVQVRRASTTERLGRAEEGRRNRKSFKVTVTVAASGATPTGTVEIYKGAKLLGTGTLGPTAR